ncbi:MAG: hypothetical protein VKN13_07030 [Cyanobacteriota bacterium]|nr:hypothetical protein [Cyanobacteriota bacterium]
MPRLPVHWILANRLAVGPMPQHDRQWQQLEELGFRARFSCCYAEEQQPHPAPPPHWGSFGVALPDHRRQEPLVQDRLDQAISEAIQAMDDQGPLFLHCLAGRERSPLVAIGVTARCRGLDVYGALDWVRKCHPSASPLFDQLEQLEQLLLTAP